jgi:hydantoinase/carbamoylase family amidase
VRHLAPCETKVITVSSEEGARFPMSMCASGVWAGEIPLEKCHNLKEVGRGGKTMKQELQRIGYLGAVEASHKASPIAAHFELHIEQGPHLESHNQKIGIVQGVQAYKWFTIKVTGRDCHTGTTGFANRRDAMLSAAKMIVASNRIANKIGGLASTGILELSPGSVNTVPGDVMFSLDIRAPEDGQVEAMEREMRKAFVNIASGLPLDDRSDMYEMKNLSTQVEWQLDFASPATKFHKVCIKCVEDASRTLLGSEYEQLSAPLTSGAGKSNLVWKHLDGN